MIFTKKKELVLDSIDPSLKNKLKKGDIILYHGHSWLSKIIQELDNSKFNHCAVFDEAIDDNYYIYEAIGDGIKHRPLKNSLSESESSVLLVKRLKNPPKNMHRVIESIQSIIVKDTEYSVSQILLFGGILLNKKITSNKRLFSLTHMFLLYAGNQLEKTLDSNNENLTCSELVYRAYNEINHPHYTIEIDYDSNATSSPYSKVKFDENSRIFRLKRELDEIKKKIPQDRNQCALFEHQCIESLDKIEDILNEPIEINSVTVNEIPSENEIHILFNEFTEETKIIESIQEVSERICNIEPESIFNKKIEKLITYISHKNNDQNENIKNRKSNISFFRTNFGKRFDLIFEKLEISNFITPGDIDRAFNLEEIEKTKIHHHIDEECHFCNH